ncbi:hypothetical protein AABB24_030616, partial [Solanum stoloniferum]
VHTATTAKKRPPHPLRLPLPFTCQTPNDPTAPRSSPLPHLLPAAFSPARPRNQQQPVTSRPAATASRSFRPDLEGFSLNVEPLTAFPHPLGKKFEIKVGFESQFYPFPL